MNETQAAWIVEQQATLLDWYKRGRAISSVRTSHDSLLLEQWELRRRAAARFPDPQCWFWTPRSFAQASDWASAVFKASLFPSGIEVVDGCCGAGVDLVALADGRDAIGIDQDAALVTLANANLRLHDRPGHARIGTLPASLDPAAAWLHLDPDRRSQQGDDRRLNAGDRFSPSLNDALAAIGRVEGGMLKLAPSTEIPTISIRELENQTPTHRCWVGNSGQAKQQLLLTGTIAAHFQSNTPSRTAVLCEPGQDRLSMSGESESIPQYTQDIGKYLYDCHPILYCSGLQGVWAMRYAAKALSDRNGYYTSESELLSPWAQCFRVLEVLPWDRKTVARWLKDHAVGTVEVKKRLVDIDANAIQNRLSGATGRQITLLITQVGQRTKAILAERVRHRSSPDNATECRDLQGP